MFRKLAFASFAFGVLTFLLTLSPASSAQAQTGNEVAPVIRQNIDESKLFILRGNTRPEAKPGNNRGPVANNLLMEHMLLQLRRPPEQEQALTQFIDQLHRPESPNFHHWLTAEQFGERFGLAQQDIDTITRWLESYGFQINTVYPSRILIDFSGTAGQVNRAFHTEIHQLEVSGVKRIANMRDPEIPAALAPAIVGIVSLHDFRPRPMVKLHRDYTFSDSLGGTAYAVVPGDLATIYNFNPLFSSGISGQGQTIVVVEDTDVFSTSDWSTFRSTFGLTSYSSGSFTQVHPAPPSGPNNCSDPGVIGTPSNPVDAEAILDAEYASAAAPSAAIQLASCSDTSTTFGGLIAIQNLINTSATPPAIVSVSYGECEAVNGQTANAAYNSTYQQAVAEGVSVYVAAGDSGAAGCDPNQSAATSGIAVSAFASTPYNVAVGGTDFGDTYAGTNGSYWNSGNTSNYASALSYVPEIPWNDSCAGALLANFEGLPAYGSGSLCNLDGGLDASLLGVLTTGAGSGGPSGCATGSPSISGVVSGSCAGYPKPSWQVVYGNPCGSNCGSTTNDGVRDIPDVSLFAAAGLWSHYYLFCWSDTTNGGAACTGAPSGWTGAGGTSFAAPIMAGVQALVNQKTGSSQGNPNPVFYGLAAVQYGASGDSSCNSSLGNTAAGTCIFYDVTLGDMAVDCAPLVVNNQTIGVFDCFDSADGYGVLSTLNGAYQPSYGTGPGWDFATGIGSVNVANLVNNWQTSTSAAALSITKTHTGNFTQGQQNATYTVTVSNGAIAAPTSGTVTVTETVPSGLTLVSMAGTGWTCAAGSCTRSDTLNAAGSYPAITVTVNVASSASSPQVNQVNVSGGGSASAGASDSTTITAVGGAVASFVGSDTSTEGSWQGVYGSDGYSVANDSQIIPSYATFAVQNQLNYTWTPSTTDLRALQKGSGTGRIAAAWYNNPKFNFDVNFTDGNPHQFSLYALDWSYQGRSETIQIVDANTAAVLDTRSISGFTNGIYLIWNISGHVKINVTLTGGVNAVVSGVFFGGKTTRAALSITKTHTGNFTQGQQNATYTVTVSNGAIAAPTSGTVTVTETVPSGLTLVSMAGTGWTCAAGSCTRSDTLNAAGSYPAITVTVNVASSASSPQVNQVNVSGGGSASAGATDSTTITAAVLSITKTHTGNFTQGQQNATYTVTVSNGAIAAPTSGTVTVTETVPSGLTLVSMAGTGWTCAAGSCTRSDTLNAAGSYPAITVTVNVASSASSPQVNQVNVSGGGSASAGASDSTTITAVGGAVASFVGSDTSTEGSWQGVYGSDGYSVANDSQIIPSYATFAVQNQLNYAWTPSTTDLRALQKGSGTGRIAAAWYNNPKFNFDVNFTDGNPHQFSLYALDWSYQGRSETIQIVDANTAAVLDTRSISSFTNGIYLIWNISGHVKINVTLTGGVNAVVSGVFFGGKTTRAALSITKTHTGNFTQGQQNATYTVTVSNGAIAAPTSGTVTVTETVPSGLTLVSMAGTGWTCAAGSCTRSDTLNAAGSYPAITVTVNVASSASSPQVNQVNVSGGGSASAGASDSTTITAVGGAVASFVGSDTSTEGSWQGVYGSDGYSVANDSQIIPSYATFAVQNQLNYTWTPSTTDLRALQKGSGTGRIAAAWYNNPKFNFDVNFTDGNSHQFALYALDWTSQGRSETIQVVDANTAAVLDTRSISGFTNGIYLIWNISGHVKINVTLTGGVNAVVSGVFFK